MKSSEERDSLRRKAEVRRIERADGRPLILLEEPAIGHPHVDERGWVDGVDVIVSSPVIDAEEVVARWQNTVDLAGPVVAQLTTPVAGEPEECFLFVAELVIDPRSFGVEDVAARIVAYKVVPALNIAQLVRQGIELEISLRDWAQPVGPDNVVGERVPLDAAV